MSMTQYDIRLTLWGWIGLSVVVHVLTRFLLWRFQAPRSGRLGRWAAYLQQSALTPWFSSAGRIAYFILLPYALLLKGINNTRWMGLSNLDWPRSLGVGVPVALLATAMLSLAVWQYRRATRNPAPLVRAAFLTEPWGWAALLPTVIFQEIHWAFYRSGTQTLGLGPYWGIFSSLLIIGVEQALDPFVARDLTRPSRSLSALFPLLLSVLSTIWFYFTANLWMTIILHWSVEWFVLHTLIDITPKSVYNYSN